jgi:hypothetical protein
VNDSAVEEPAPSEAEGTRVLLVQPRSVREFSPSLTFHLFRFRFSVYSV